MAIVLSVMNISRHHIPNLDELEIIYDFYFDCG